MKQQLSKHRTIGAALAVACSAVMAFTVSAETAGGVTLNLSTDKTSYTSGENVNVSVSVRNDNDYAINNVSVASTLPRFYHFGKQFPDNFRRDNSSGRQL